MAKKISELAVGAKVKDPSSAYYGSPIIWQVAAKNHPGYPSGSATLITEKIITLKAFDAIEASNPDSSRDSYGNNRYLHSNIRQWLNKEGSPWYQDQHSYDEPPSGNDVSYNPYTNESGFLSNLSADFKKHILTTSLKVVKANVDGGGSETVQDKVFLASTTEVGLADENGIAEGSRLAIFSSSNSSRLAYPTDEAVDNSDYTNNSFNTNEPWYWWLRTPYSGNSYDVRYVYTSGALVSGIAGSGNRGARPLLNFSSEVLVSDSPDADGAYVITYNATPNITLNESNNRTLYENDTLSLSGEVVDADAGNVVSVKYSINNGAERAIASGVSNGSTAIPYDKTLTFKNGRLLDGSNAITDNLAEGIAHTLRVWGEDDKGGKSTIQSRTFYVVANRPPTLSVDPFETQNDLIDSEAITISGTTYDPEDNEVTVRYRLNGANFIQVYNGQPGNFSFTLPVTSLNAGVNTLTIQVVDSYNFTTQKTFSIQREHNAIPVESLVARYNLSPATGTALGLISWIERDSSAVLNAGVSMTDAVEQESYAAMAKTNTVELVDGLTEDEFSYNAGTAKEKVVLKLKSTGDIARISGAFQA